jgi:hypothetical protein
MGTSPENRDRRTLTRIIKLPRLSGKASATWLIVCFALTAALIPRVLGLPLWIDFEIVLAVWWAVWLVLLARLLYTGRRVTHDFELKGPRKWFSSSESGNQSTSQPSSSGGSWSDGFFWGSLVGDSEAVAVGCLIVIGLVLLLGAVWFLIEVAIPVTAFLLYFVVRGMLARVVNDRHHCRGRLMRSVAAAVLWATVYTAPLAGAVWFVHYMYRTKG